jgi:methyl-accepting chemotaxis protein
MNKLKISTRLALLLGILSLVIAINGAIGIISNYKTNASLKTVYEDRTVCIGQISDAITQVDISTQKNAALVEESANASQSTSDQAASLVEAVASLKVS